MGVTGMTVYHGQDVRPGETEPNQDAEEGEEEVVSAWRVDNGGHTQWTGRNGFYCRNHDTEQWFVGAPLAVATQDRVISALQAFGERLWREGYVSRPGLQLILQGGSSLDDEIDPENPGTLVHSRTGTSSVIGDVNPYNLNWLYENGYILTPNPPPND